MIKQLKIHQSNKGEQLCYGVPGETQGSWHLLDPIELENNELATIINESDLDVIASELDKQGTEYVYYNYLIQEPVKYVSCEHFDAAVSYILSIGAPAVSLVRIARAQLNLSLYDCKMFAEGVRAGYTTARAAYLNAKFTFKA